MESSMWSARQPQWLITDNSLPQTHRGASSGAFPVRSPWRLAVSLATNPPPRHLPTPSSAQLVAPLKSNDLFRHHLHSHCLLITTTNALWIVLVLSVALAAWLSGCWSSNFQCRKTRHQNEPQEGTDVIGIPQMYCQTYAYNNPTSRLAQT